MKNKLITTSFVLFTIFLLNVYNTLDTVALDSRASSEIHNKYKGRYIVKLKDNISQSERNKFLEDNGIEQKRIGKEQTISNKLITNSKDLKGSELVESTEEDATLQTQTAKPNDKLYNDQWYLAGIDYSSMYAKPNENDVTVAVIDSGICINHPDLEGRTLPGWNFIDNNEDIIDELGHGCEISGLIAANTNNELGIAGGSLNTKIMPLKVIDDDGAGSYSDLINAISYAISKNVNIINISLGGMIDSTILHTEIKKAKDAGITIVAAAGNTSNSEIMYPANYSEVVSVGSVENDYTISPFSSNSQSIKAWSFGSSILTTSKDNEYKKVNGTSLSAAIVSAFIAGGGKYENGGIVNYSSNSKKPVFMTGLVNISETKSNLSLNVPANLEVSGFTNKEKTDEIINWQKVISLSNSESLVISIWNRDSKKDIDQLFLKMSTKEGCLNNEYFCITNYPQPAGESAFYSLFYKVNNNLIRVIYRFDNFIGINIFKKLASEILIKNSRLISAKQLDYLDQKVQTTEKIIPQTECGGIDDPEVDFGCCNNDANCTWWAAHMRHDLRGKVIHNAGQWIEDAEDAGVPISNSPSVGAIAVWSGHVAYVKSIISSTQIEISEMNCDNYDIPFRDSATVYTNTYGAVNSGYEMTLMGFIPSPNNCNGNNPTISNWNVSSALTCSPTGSLTIMPDSSLSGQNGNIIIQPN